MEAMRLEDSQACLKAKKNGRHTKRNNQSIT